MQYIKELLKEANQLLNKADHLTYITYPSIKEPKLLCLVIEDLQKATDNIMQLVLYRERLYKRIDPIKKVYSQEFEIFKKIAKRYGIDENQTELVKDLKKMVIANKESPMRFKRKDKYVICSNDYKMNVIDIKKVKDYVQKTKIIVHNINRRLI